ncbi:MAG: hypothetical protein RL385_3289 [Pseudomonadota bacterium]
MTPEPSVSNLVLRALLHAAESAGASRRALQRELGLTDEQLALAHARVPRSELSRICACVVAHAGESLALHWTESLRERSFGPVTHTLAYSGSLRQGFALLAQFGPLIFDGPPAYVLLDEGSTFAVRDGGWFGASSHSQRFSSEMLFSGMLKLVQTYFPLAQPVRVSLVYAAPAYAHEYLRRFGPHVNFDQAHSEIVFEGSLLDAPSPHADPDMYVVQKNIAERHLVLATARAPYAVRVRELLIEAHPLRLSMVGAASALGLSERSLRYALTAEGTSYREVEYAALGTLAKQLLQRSDRTIQEAAFEMGFSDASTFHRACKRWTGLTPSALRLGK